MAVPLTLAGVSRRFCGVPTSVNAAASLSLMSVGTGRRAASSASSPYDRLRPPAACVTTAWAAVQVAGSTFQRRAAACTSMVRAAAPASRNGFQSARIEAEPPVACSPSSGLVYSLRSGGDASSRTWSMPTSSSSATSIAADVQMPWPHSVSCMISVTAPDRSMRI